MESEKSQGEKQVIQAFPRERWEPNCHFELRGGEPPLTKENWMLKPQVIFRQAIRVCDYTNFFAVNNQMMSHHKEPAARDFSLSTGYEAGYKVLLQIMETIVVLWKKDKRNPMFDGLQSEMERLYNGWTKYRPMQDRKKASAKRSRERRKRERAVATTDAPTEQESGADDPTIGQAESTGDVLTMALDTAQEHVHALQSNVETVKEEIKSTLQQITTLREFKVQKEKELHGLTETIQQEEEQIEELQEIIRERAAKKSKK